MPWHAFLYVTLAFVTFASCAPSSSSSRTGLLCTHPYTTHIRVYNTVYTLYRAKQPSVHAKFDPYTKCVYGSREPPARNMCKISCKLQVFGVFVCIGARVYQVPLSAIGHWSQEMFDFSLQELKERLRKRIDEVDATSHTPLTKAVRWTTEPAV